MQLIIKARHMAMTPSMRDYAEDKIGTALARICDGPAARVEVELSDLGHTRAGARQECRISLALPGMPIQNICEVDDDLYKAIDLAHDRILMKVKRMRARRLAPSRLRKLARSHRASMAREVMTAAPEPWEREVAEFERSIARA